jgi:hypothetical protein
MESVRKEGKRGEAMERDAMIRELNDLWMPVRPYLAQQVGELYGRRDGRVLDAAPSPAWPSSLPAQGSATPSISRHFRPTLHP